MPIGGNYSFYESEFSRLTEQNQKSREKASALVSQTGAISLLLRSDAFSMREMATNKDESTGNVGSTPTGSSSLKDKVWTFFWSKFCS
jgi:hypothetical protein